MFCGEYSTDSLEYIAAVSELNEHYDDALGDVIPEEYVPTSGSNYESLKLGYDGENVVLLKPGDANFGRAGPSHLAVALASERMDFNCPSVWYDSDEDMIVMEHKGPLDTVRSAEDFDGLEEGVVPKVVCGDPDIISNVGYDGFEWFAYDFDQAGSPLTRVESSMDVLLDYSRPNLGKKEFMDEAASRVAKVSVNDLVEEVDDVLSDYFPRSLGFNDFDLRTFETNIRSLSDREC